MQKTQRILIFLLIVLIAVIFFKRTGAQKEATQQQSTNGTTVPVRIMKIVSRDIQETIEYIGDIKGQAEVAVYPKVTGKIMEKLKGEGDLVQKGDVIAYVDRDEVGLKFERAPVESPLTGFVGRVYADIGTNVSPQTPVALVVDIDQVKINLELPEIYLPKIAVGQPAAIKLDPYPEKSFSGQVTKISPVVDTTTRSAPIEILIGNQDHKLKSGMFARVLLIIQEQKAVPVVLKEALIGQGNEFSVYVVKDQKAHLQNVTPGIQQGPYIEIRQGLAEGDHVVIMGQQKLTEGVSVTAEE
ncbi:MAG: efflux RND transporter periplasmic adaptor subunit [Candidatus Omnitrophica bacterium]|nr:efflux RND transporter periplasmic adaptor subunit [Candidatus Omnitrophota bacterium]